MPEKIAILVVSFGTSVSETRIRTTEAIENYIADTYPQFPVYRAWTSNILRKKVLEQENLHIDSVSDALIQMKRDGIRHVIIQPTFVVDGNENEQLKLDALRFAADFASLHFGAPLLSDANELKTIASAVIQEFSHFSEDSLVVLMGHGVGSAGKKRSSDRSSLNRNEMKQNRFDSDLFYKQLDENFSALGAENMVLRLMDRPTSVCELVALAAKRNAKQVVLAPFMIVAGKHALKDMAGSESTSWKSQFEAAGFPVFCILKGLGEYKTIQKIFADHAAKAISELGNC